MSKSNKVLLILLLGLVVGGGMLQWCGGIGGLSYFGLGMVATDVEEQLRDHPVIQTEIGEIESFEMSLTKSAVEPEDDVFVFEVTGTKGEGEVTAKIYTNSDAMEEIIWARIKTSRGETIDLIP